jgi:GT2 family glycosyltransferase
VNHVTVTAVVPLYNKARYVLRTLDSIAAQTFHDFEVIVVDDGSTDDGPELVEQYGDRRFRLIRQPNAGPGAARNRGIAEAAGDYVAFLDADDVWLPAYLDEALRMFQSDPRIAAVSCGYLDTPPGLYRKQMWRTRGIVHGAQRVTPAIRPSVLSHMIAWMSPCSTVMRLDAVRRWGGFYAQRGCRFGEDSFLMMRVLLNEWVYFNWEEPHAHMYRDASALSNNQLQALPLDAFLADPDGIFDICPPELRPLAERTLALRACKRACVMGYFGEWKQARDLLRRFVTWKDWSAPYAAPALLAATPIGRLLGRPALAVIQRLQPHGAFAHVRIGSKAALRGNGANRAL